MRFWTAPHAIFPYSVDEVVATFWDRYPNSFAKHIMSEDVLERKVTEHTIVTKKLIVKQGSSILKRVPRWLTRMTDIRVVPVIEESVYDRRTRTLSTYTRNVSHNELFAMHESCNYKATPECMQFPMTDVFRRVFISIDCGRMSSMYEKVMLMGFKKSIANTSKGMTEKLYERLGSRVIPPELASTDRLKKLKEKILKSHLVSEAKCDE